MINEPFEEQELCVTRIEVDDGGMLYSAAALQAKRGSARIFEPKPEGWILASIRGGEWVPVFDACAVQLVEVEIEDGYLHHIGVIVEAGERLPIQELPLRLLQHLPVHDPAGEVSRLRMLA